MVRLASVILALAVLPAAAQTEEPPPPSRAAVLVGYLDALAKEVEPYLAARVSLESGKYTVSQILEQVREDVGDAPALSEGVATRTPTMAAGPTLRVEFEDHDALEVLRFLDAYIGCHLALARDGGLIMLMAEEAGKLAAPGAADAVRMRDALGLIWSDRDPDGFRSEKAKAEAGARLAEEEKLLAREVRVTGETLTLREIATKLEGQLGVPCLLDAGAWHDERTWDLPDTARPAAEIVKVVGGGLKIGFKDGVLWFLAD
ncbi:MAG: hypothetical protein HUU15_08675 [Candidatus Brocadiae bacterium]|nr:hypothetical protein [Candidatus Brocadiia bacterium]